MEISFSMEMFIEYMTEILQMKDSDHCLDNDGVPCFHQVIREAIMSQFACA